MVRRTQLYMNKRNTALEIAKACDKATALDYDCLVSYLPEIREAKSTRQLNSIIKKMNGVWKSLNLPSF